MIILYSDSRNLGRTPARVNRLTGEIFLNMDVWDKYPKAYQDFILAHEEGHYLGQETNELFADHYALMKIAGTFRNSLKSAVNTITDILPGTSAVQKIRTLNIYRLALLYDLSHHPQKQTSEQLLKVEKELSAYKNFNDLKQYEMILSQMRKGKPTDYDFPGYNKQMFQSSIGSEFVDVPMQTETPMKSEFEKRYTATSEPATEQGGTFNQEPEQPESCDVLTLIEDVPQRVSFDLKTFGIVVLVALVVVLISKLNK